MYQVSMVFAIANKRKEANSILRLEVMPTKKRMDCDRMEWGTLFNQTVAQLLLASERSEEVSS